MDRKSFGLLVATLRKELRNEFDEVMTQFDLAELANISIVTLQKIEQGRSVNLPADVILHLANALRLPSRARQEFFLSSLGIEDAVFVKFSSHPQDVLSLVLRAMTNLQTPCFMADVFGDIIACSPALPDLFDLDLAEVVDANLLTQFNMFRLMFAPEFSKLRGMMGEQQSDFLRRMVLVYKVLTLGYRNHWYFSQILPELNRFPLFREQWHTPFYEEYDVVNLFTPFNIRHPRFGGLDFIISVTQTMTAFGDVNLYNFLPVDAVTAQVCVRLMEEAGHEPVMLVPWPKVQVMET